ncbi:MAG: iron-sulfur cluster insertion protein ErpA [Proteobacteria bacterium]|nr:iron-sulfur cluster insertion protein ErpA [Pseudomonadota bacterium]NBP13489.1 iron-sulfur cluster insertion protein ErpA [bacterium]
MITVTESASRQIRKVQSEENTNSPLRVFVQGGGCSGFTYAFTFEDDPAAADDFVIDAYDGVKVLVDAMSMNLLSGAEIDFKKDLTSSQFVIRNPNASATCGCGSSFSV